MRTNQKSHNKYCCSPLRVWDKLRIASIAPKQSVRRQSTGMRWFATLSVTLLLMACTSEKVQGFRSSDKQYMEDMVFLLHRAEVSYQEYQDGSIRYKSADEDAVRKIREKIENAISVRYEEAQAREYLKTLLSEGNLEYRAKSRDGKVWIRWYPESKEQEKKIDMKVVQYVFEQKVKVE